MPRRLSVIFFLFILIISPFAPRAHGFGSYGGLSLPFSYDRSEAAHAIGIDQNAVLAGYVSAGWSFRHWDKNVIGWHNGEVRNEWSGYLGIAFSGLLQVQAGVSQAGWRMRVRSDIPITGAGVLSGDRKPETVVQGIMLSPFVETNFDRGVYGICLGFSY